MPADETMDGSPIDPVCPIHGLVEMEENAITMPLAVTALTDQQMAAGREQYRHHGAIHAEYFRSLLAGQLPLELAAVMVREMANVYWNLELRK